MFKQNKPNVPAVNTARNAALKRKANEERVSKLPIGTMGYPGNKYMKFTNRVRGINRLGYGSTRSKNQWIEDKSEDLKYIDRHIISTDNEFHRRPQLVNTPLNMNELSKYRNPNIAKTIRNVPRHATPEIALENALGHRQPKLETGGRRKTRKNKKSRKNRR